MTSNRLAVLIFIFSIAGYALIFPSFEGMRKEVKETHLRGLTLPPVLVKLMSFEFRSIAADLFFIRVSQFYGGKIERMEGATKEDWQWLNENLLLITELDPYFEDPYYMANAFLAWNARMIDEANFLLMRGTEKRSWDWNFPFYIGFNKAYFQGENKEGAKFLLKAYERPGAWKGLATLAARLYHAERETETAIVFLTKFYENETNPGARRWLRLRIDVLERILVLEKAIESYRDKVGVSPNKIVDLVTDGIIERIPEDPYGGDFYIDGKGKVRTTSQMALKLKKAGTKTSPSAADQSQ